MDNSKMKVLIIDDSLSARMLPRALLKNNGFVDKNILLAGSGEVSLEKYWEIIQSGFSLDIAIIDTEMLPGMMSGPETMRALRAEGYKGPIIQVSGSEQTKSPDADTMLLKKNTQSSLFSEIKKLLEAVQNPAVAGPTLTLDIP